MKRKREGLFEKTPGSGFWWVRCRDYMGVMRVLPVGGRAIAAAVFRAWQLKERALRVPKDAWADALEKDCQGQAPFKGESNGPKNEVF
jgi:hypothetical protein